MARCSSTFEHHRLRRALRRRRRLCGRRFVVVGGRLWVEERGFALVELLFVSVLMVVVLCAVLTSLASVTSVENRDRQRALAIQDGQVGLSRMVREIRQAYSVLATTPNSVDFLVTLNGQQLRVFYACDVPQPGTSYNECVRLQTTVGGVLPALSGGAAVVLRVMNGSLANPVFSFTPSALMPQYVDARVELPAGGELSSSSGFGHMIVLNSGAYLRNLGVGG
jgi:type II secretory pathway pseudopilin PulG